MNVPSDDIYDPTLQDASSSNSTHIKFDDDTDVRLLVQDAYDIPPVPRALLKRVDAQVREQWGVSPGLATSARKPSGSAASRRVSVRGMAWRLTACLVLLACVIALVQGTGAAYGWATVFRALSQQSVVQVDDPDAVDQQRFFSVQDGVWAEQSASSHRLVTTKDRSVYLQNAGGPVVRTVLAKSQVQPEYLVMQTLTGVDVRPDFQVANESWQRQSDSVELTMTVQDSVQRFNVNLTLNPETHLPIKANVVAPNGQVRMLSYRYPGVSPAELIAQVMPEAFAGTIIDSAAVQEAGSDVTDIAAVVPKGVEPDVNKSTRAIKKGAASLGWESLTIVPQTDDEAVYQINSTLKKVWNEKGITPVGAASDEEMLRRVYLDLTGRTPTVTEVRSYLADPSPNRYEQLVEYLLNSRDHATHLATVWRNFLLPEGVDLTKFGGVTAFDEWLSEKFEANTSYDQLVRELLLAEGRLSKSGPLLFYSSLKLDADQLASRTARVFLGMRLDCAQCHDDPFEPWTQEDFWSYAAFFARISRPQAELEAVSTVMRVRDTDHGEVMMPFSDDPIAPRFLDGQTFEETASRRHELSKWLTSGENPYFARAAANRVWALMFGKGIVDPVDGFGKTHTPKSPELLDNLASYFISHDFSLRDLFRTIAMSDAYRLSSGAPTANQDRLDYFAQMNVKTFSAEQVYDCITVATLLDDAPVDGYFVDRFGNSAREEFLAQFKTSAGKVTEYQGGIPQALTLMNGSLISGATGLSTSGLLRSLDAPFFTDEQRIEVLYLATLSRKPTENEWNILKDYLARRDNKMSVQEPLADVLWALLNSAEFTMNH